MKKIYEGRTREDAIRIACEDLNVDKEDLVVEVLEDDEPKKTMFSILDRKRVKISVEVKKQKRKAKESKSEKPAKKAIKSTENIDSNIELLDKVLKEFAEMYKKDNFAYEINKADNAIHVNIDVDKKNRWIGYRGKTLNAIQSILTAILMANFNEYTRVFVNIGTYKEERRKQLETLAAKVSATIKKTKKKVVLEPMSSYERKIIHDFIAKDPDLKSESIGDEPNRKVVVSLK